MSPAFDELDPTSYELPARVIEQVLSPALVVWLDKVRRNLDRLLGWVDGDADRLRPHLKTTKLPRVWAELVRRGLRNFKCATTREAACMLDVFDSEHVAGDLLVAYPHVGPALERLGDLAAAHPEARLSVLCEDAGAIDTIPEALGVFVDVNPGMNRTGIPLADATAIIAVAERAGERFRGVHHYEGHVHDGPLDERLARGRALYDELMALVHSLDAHGVSVGEIVTSGTPSFVPALEYLPFRSFGGTHRISPGTIVYHDARSETECAELDFEPAALVMSRIISQPKPGIATCDAGSKAIAAEAGDPVAVVLGHPELTAERPSEEHLPLVVAAGEPPARGTVLLLIPRHVCPTVNLAEEAIVIEAGRLVAIEPVSARAHAT